MAWAVSRAAAVATGARPNDAGFSLEGSHVTREPQSLRSSAYNGRIYEWEIYFAHFSEMGSPLRGLPLRFCPVTTITSLECPLALCFTFPPLQSGRLNPLCK
jgi:hypothetical protein